MNLKVGRAQLPPKQVWSTPIPRTRGFEDLWYEQLQKEQKRMRQAERIVLALRRKLIALDPSLPIEYDGTAWAQIEAEYLEP